MDGGEDHVSGESGIGGVHKETRENKEEGHTTKEEIHFSGDP